LFLIKKSQIKSRDINKELEILPKLVGMMHIQAMPQNHFLVPSLMVLACGLIRLGQNQNPGQNLA